MPSERIQRRTDSLLDDADEAVAHDDRKTVRQRANAALSLADARGYASRSASSILGAA